MCSHVMLDLFGSLQVCDLLAYHCHSCALESYMIEQGGKKAKWRNSECRVCMK